MMLLRYDIDNLVGHHDYPLDVLPIHEGLDPFFSEGRGFQLLFRRPRRRLQFGSHFRVDLNDDFDQVVRGQSIVPFGPRGVDDRGFMAEHGPQLFTQVRREGCQESDERIPDLGMEAVDLEGLVDEDHH